MRKEVLVAILVGAALGLVVAFGIWRANQAFAPQGTETTPQPLIEQKQERGLVINEPEDGTIVAEDSLTVGGKARPAATIVILTNLSEIIIQADQGGNFEQDAKLEGGANEIIVAAYDQEGNKEEKTITVVFSTEFPGE